MSITTTNDEAGRLRAPSRSPGVRGGTEGRLTGEAAFEEGFAAGLREAQSAAPAAPTDPRRLNQTNRGLRMILTAAVIIVIISWGATVARDYFQHLTAVALIDTDKDALRVMCAMNPPTEREFGWMHICEAAAGAGSAAPPAETADAEAAKGS